MDEKRNEIGYHATSVENAESILNTGFKKSISTNRKMHWLGDGVYFFTDIAWAVQWNINELNKRKNKNRTKNEFTILESIINVDDNHTLDLSSVIGKIIVGILKECLIKKLKECKEEELIKKINNRSLKFFLNLLDDYGFLDKYYIVKATYIDRRESRKVRYSDDFILRAQCQICVRNIKCIKETKMYKNTKYIDGIYNLLKSEGEEDGEHRKNKKRNRTNGE